MKFKIYRQLTSVFLARFWVGHARLSLVPRPFAGYEATQGVCGSRRLTFLNSDSGRLTFLKETAHSPKYLLQLPEDYQSIMQIKFWQLP